MTETPRLSDQLRDIAIHAPIGFGRYNREALFEAADALEAKEPIPTRAVVKETGVS